MKGQITHSISENLTDSDLESKTYWIYLNDENKYKQLEDNQMTLTIELIDMAQEMGKIKRTEPL